jgi:hypothetical protein
MNGHKWSIDKKNIQLVVGNNFIRGIYKETMKELKVVL